MLEGILLQTVRVLGVVLGLAGTFIVSREAVWAALTAPLKLAVSVKTRVLVWCGRPTRGNVFSTTGMSSFTVGSSADAMQAWPDGADAEAQIDVLRARTEALDAALRQLRIANHSMIDELRGDMHRRFEEHEQARVAIIEDIEQERRTNLAVNARGVPLLGWSIVLSGVPDWALTPVVSCVLIAASCLLTVGTMFSKQLENFIANTPSVR